MGKKDIKLEALKKRLTELFQLDKADLDFGIYRILNQKRKDVEHFVQSDLPEIVNEELAKYDSGKNVELQSELDNALKNAKELGVDPESTDKVKELRAQLKESISKDDIEAEVYSSLTDFFSRYYDEGDFISQRRYKDGVYAIPYEGEEVKLHWANADQYYIKTTEDFANFSFYIDEDQTRRVSFQIVKAETEKDNNKESESKKRRFVLLQENPVEIIDGTLAIKFTYEVSAVKQESLNQQTEEVVVQLLPQEFLLLFAKAPTEKDKNRTVFGKWLGQYTSKNTFDYFIHKDLSGFLSRELDFYIKNEILRIDDLDAFADATNSRLISKIKVFKHIAESIIAFLAQLEDLQKKLWEKKKFIFQSDYVLTLDNVDESLYDTIVKNKDQLNDWVNLGFIDGGTIIDIEYLRNHKTLQIDTKYYPDQKHNILQDIDDLDKNTNGLLINSENYQAMTLLGKLYDKKVRAIYADPPYNTDSSEILYKNGYKSSTWLSLISNVLPLARSKLQSDGIFCITIDDEQQKELSTLLSQYFGVENILGTITIRINPSGRIKLRGFAQSHEYAIFAGNSTSSAMGKLPRSDLQQQRFNKKDEKGVYEQRNFRREGSSSERIARPKRFFPIYVSDTGLIRIPEMRWVESSHSYDDIEKNKHNETVVWPIDDSGGERVWRWGLNRINREISEVYSKINGNGSVQIYYKYRPNEDGVLANTVWVDKKYSATEYGTSILKDMFGGRNQFSFPKAVPAVEDCIIISTSGQQNSIILDYYAGSGTTAHATINLNRTDGGNRKYILIEMGTYFNSVTEPRVMKAAFSTNWKDGKPVDSGGSGTSQIIKYIQLESYEDTLNNLQFKQQTKAQRSFLDADKTIDRDYRINYMLDFESQDSPSLLNLEQFEDPFNYEMLIQDNANRLIAKKVDLVDTFNYLLGIHVEHIEQKRGFVVVQGKQNDETRTLIIWRNVNDNPNNKLNEFLEKSDYNPRDGEFDVIYVNGDNNVENLQSTEDTWKVRLIEEEFHKRMFS